MVSYGPLKAPDMPFRFDSWSIWTSECSVMIQLRSVTSQIPTNVMKTLLIQKHKSLTRLSLTSLRPSNSPSGH